MTFSMATGNTGPAGISSTGNAAGGFKEKIPHGYKKGTLQQFTPEMMQLFSQLFGHVGPDSYLSKLAGGDEAMFQQMEQPAWRQFQEAQGQLGSRFSGFGMGAQKGSGFRNAAGQQASDFAMQLAAQRQQLQRQALEDLMGYSNTLLSQKPYENYLVQKPQEESSGAGGLIGGAIGGIGGFMMGGPAGALTGAKLGYSVGSGF